MDDAIANNIKYYLYTFYYSNPYITDTHKIQTGGGDGPYNHIHFVGLVRLTSNCNSKLLRMKTDARTVF